MPSPTSTTVPTLLTDNSFSKPAICVRRMSPISVARRTIVHPVSLHSSIEESVATNIVTLCSGFQSIAQATQLIRHAAIDQLISDSGYNAANDRWIDLGA